MISLRKVNLRPLVCYKVDQSHGRGECASALYKTQRRLWAVGEHSRLSDCDIGVVENMDAVQPDHSIEENIGIHAHSNRTIE